MKTRQNYSPHRIEIDNTATFLNWAKTVQFDVTHWARPRCDYQDDYARTSREVIDAAFNGATPDERRVILCAVYNTMSYDEVERLLLVRAKDVRRVEMAAAYAELDEADRKRGAALARREDAINAREHALKEAAKPIHKRLAEQRRQIDTLRRQLDDATRRADVAREERNASKLQALEYEIKAGRFDTIRAALIGEV